MCWNILELELEVFQGFGNRQVLRKNIKAISGRDYG